MLHNMAQMYRYMYVHVSVHTFTYVSICKDFIHIVQTGINTESKLSNKLDTV